MTSTSQHDFNSTLGARLQRLRAKKGLTQEQVVLMLAGFGVQRSRPAMSSTENGLRSVGAYELASLAAIYGVALTDLLADLPSPEPVEVGPDAATVNAAQSLGWPPEEVDRRALQAWGRGLTAERDARMGAATRTRGDQARRGHVTRRLIEELRQTPSA